MDPEVRDISPRHPRVRHVFLERLEKFATPITHPDERTGDVRRPAVMEEVRVEAEIRRRCSRPYVPLQCVRARY
jgi:hypothetical protein